MRRASGPILNTIGTISSTLVGIDPRIVAAPRGERGHREANAVRQARTDVAQQLADTRLRCERAASKSICTIETPGTRALSSSSAARRDTQPIIESAATFDADDEISGVEGGTAAVVGV